ncbi:M48 family peptidase [Desulfosporosinus fructosivorans]|uniref:M48 family peptidase n=1 Tax=Desulfosporosinus fructosivorans TaxID=2018669 RepID=A0A4Z0R7T3_9FIRM|nr:M48 family metallopeptidase [Desulfosporosinus fructosivorans]TGE38465.1 M48 family peptidase [Desulfosporosinus fructosivorans]
MNYLWLGLIVLAGAFCALYLKSALYPGPINPSALRYFSTEQAHSARAYSFVPRVLFITSFMLQASVLSWLVFSRKGATIARRVEVRCGHYWRSILMYFFLLWLFLRLLRLPFTLFGNYYWQQAWGFSTQTLAAWWLDYTKSAALDLFLATFGVLLFFAILKHWPKIWWVIGATLFAVWLVLQNFLWPVIVSPMFNHFEPAKNPAVISMVKDLANKAGIQVDEVLVMDASRRTTMANAYFMGLGTTKQIVIYDNLLENYPLDEVEAVLAHEMGHWQKGHIIQGLSLGVVGAFLSWGLLALYLSKLRPTAGHHRLQLWASVQLFLLLIMMVTNPIQNYISREMEKQADQVSLELTGDSAAVVRLQINLAAKNLSDVSPPGFIVWFGYTHPPVLSRIEAMGDY